MLGVLLLARRCQVTLAQRNFVYRPNIGTMVEKRRWHGVGKPCTVGLTSFFSICLTLAQQHHMQMSSLKCYTTFKAKLTTFGQAQIN